MYSSATSSSPRRLLSVAVPRINSWNSNPTCTLLSQPFLALRRRALRRCALRQHALRHEPAPALTTPASTPSPSRMLSAPPTLRARNSTSTAPISTSRSSRSTCIRRTKWPSPQLRTPCLQDAPKMCSRARPSRRGRSLGICLVGEGVGLGLGLGLEQGWIGIMPVTAGSDSEGIGGEAVELVAEEGRPEGRSLV